MPTVSMDARTTAEPLVHWPSPHPRMTDEEVEAWLPAAIAAGGEEAVRTRAGYFEERRQSLRKVIAALEAEAAEIDAEEADEIARNATTYDVDCVICGSGGALGVADPEHPEWPTITDHVRRGLDGCDRARWGRTVPLRAVLAAPSEYPLEGGRWTLLVDETSAVIAQEQGE